MSSYPLFGPVNIRIFYVKSKSRMSGLNILANTEYLHSLHQPYVEDLLSGWSSNGA